MKNIHIKQFGDEVTETYVLPSLESAVSVSISFDLWMSRVSHDIFSIVAHYVDSDWKSQHKSIGLLRSYSTNGTKLAEDVTGILNKYKLLGKVIATVKGNGGNMNTCTTTLQSICLPVFKNCTNVSVIFDCHCIAHSLSGACSKAFDAVPEVVEVASKLQKCVTWTKKSGKGKRFWEKAQAHVKLPIKALASCVKTRLGTKLVMMDSCLENRNAIDHLYGTMLQNESLRTHQPSSYDWEICRMALNTMEETLNRMKMNQTQYYLLSEATNDLITLYLAVETAYTDLNMHFQKLKKDVEDGTCSYNEKDISALRQMSDCMRSEVSTIAATELRFLFEPSIAHIKSHGPQYMALALDPRYKVLGSCACFGR